MPGLIPSETGGKMQEIQMQDIRKRAGITKAVESAREGVATAIVKHGGIAAEIHPKGTLDELEGLRRKDYLSADCFRELEQFREMEAARDACHEVAR